MDRLTREEIENIRRNGVHAIRFSERTDKVIELCDLALQSLSQEAVRDEALAAATKACERHLYGTDEFQHGVRTCIEAVVALKREPNAAPLELPPQPPTTQGQR